MIIENINPVDTLHKINEIVPDYERVGATFIYKDGSKEKTRFTRGSAGTLMTLRKRAKHYGYFFSFDRLERIQTIIIDDIGVDDKWLDSWRKVAIRLEKSGLWADILNDVKIGLNVGLTTIKKARDVYDVYSNDYEQRRNDAIEVDSRLAKAKDLSFILWHMSNPAKVKKMYFGKYENESRLQAIKDAFESPYAKFSCWGKSGYDVHFEYNPEEKKAWYSEEYKGCGNGHYYIALNATHALFMEDD